MQRDELRKFLVESALAGYASGDKSREVREEDKSTSVIVEEGPWRSHDNWFGGEPYGGRIVVHYQDKPVWIMTYYGKVSEEVTDIASVYRFLIRSLQRMPKEAPYRGPRQYIEGTGTNTWLYFNEWNGALEDFHGEERIYSPGQQAYQGWYRGGLINVTEDE